MQKSMVMVAASLVATFGLAMAPSLGGQVAGAAAARTLSTTVGTDGPAPVHADGPFGGLISTGYWQVQSDGEVFNYGDAANYGIWVAPVLKGPIVGAARAPGGSGLWLVGSDGGVITLGAAGYHGSTGNLRLNQPVVGMAATPDGGGYWLVARDGGVFSFGDAHFYGSTGNIRLNKPIVGMAATPDGKGYWLVASDGGIFAFGDARFFGSTGNIRLNKPIVGMAPTPTGNGYWMVASDGGIFSFGGASFHGSTGNLHLVAPITGMAATSSGGGYWLTAADGGVFTFGNAPFYGSTGGSASVSAPTVAIVGQAPAGPPITAGTIFNGNWRHHDMVFGISTDGRVMINYLTQACDPGLAPMVCDPVSPTGGSILGGGLGAQITSISGDTAHTRVTFDSFGLSSGKSTTMVYDPTKDIINYLGLQFCGTQTAIAAPQDNACGA